MKQKTSAIIINDKDNVATALQDLYAGGQVSIIIRGEQSCIELLSDVPSGHKFATTEIEESTDVIKYGESIGRSTVTIQRGQHVHTHNVISPKSRNSR